MFFGKDELTLIGSVIRTHGLTGSLFLTIQDGFPNNIIKEKMPVFLLKEGIPVPFFTESVKITGNNLIVKFNHINNIEKADSVVGCEVYVVSQIAENNNDPEIDAHSEFDGFAVFDAQYGLIGIVKNFEMIPGNPVFETEFKGKTIIIPFAEEIIVKIDDKKREIHISAPKGLIEIYLED